MLIRRNQCSSGAISAHQTHSDAISVHQTQSASIRRNQDAISKQRHSAIDGRQSEAFTGNHGSSEALSAPELNEPLTVGRLARVLS